MSTYEKFKQLLSEYDVAYANYFKSPEVLATLTKTFTSHNITVEEWNTLIDSIKNNLELSPYLKQIVDSLDDCFEDFLEQVQYLPDTVQRIQYVHSGTEKQTFIQQVGNPENLSVDDAPAENIASQWWASAFGKSNKATNYASFVCGTRNENNGDSAFVTGVGNITTNYGMCSLTFGEGNQNASRDSLVGGYYNTSSYDVNANLVVGTLLQANNDNQHIIGTANELKTGLRFAIGNGTYGVDPVTWDPINIQRKNALEVYKSGKVAIPEGGLYVRDGLLDSAGTKQLEATTNGAKANNILVATIKDSANFDRFTLGGTTTVNASLVPNTNNSRDLGAEGTNWNKAYINKVYTDNIIPSYVGSIGSLENPFNYGYIEQLTVLTSLKTNLINDKIGNLAISITPKATPADTELVNIVGDLDVSGETISTGGFIGSIKDSNKTERLSVNTSGQAIIKAHILPDNGNTRAIGNSSNYYKEIYVKTIKDNAGNEVSVADLKALITYAKGQGWIS